MNRRELLRLIGLGAVSHILDIDKLLWIPGQKTIFLPTSYPRYLGDSLYGIPYHACVYSTGVWLGIERNQDTINELVNLIRVLEESKVR